MNDLYMGESFSSHSDDDVNFLETRINDLSPFAALEVTVDGVTYKTAEHAYQSLRVIDGARDDIMVASSPLEAWRRGQKCKSEGKVVEIDKETVMEQIFRAKLQQHPYLKEVLKSTGQRTLLKIMPTDLFWGTDSAGAGQNKMGKLWMKLRDELE